MLQLFSKTKDELKVLICHLPFVISKSNIPHKPGVYFLVDDQNNFIYIGKSKNMYKRWIGRKDYSLNQNHKLYLFCPEDIKIINNLETIEAICILILCPLHNRSVRLKTSFKILW